jgi:hypothetical protein
MLLGEFRDYIKDENIKLTLMSRTVTSDRHFELWWGDPKDKMKFEPGVGDFAVRLIVLRDDGKEQRFYFMVLEGRVNDVFYPKIMHRGVFDFPEKWEAQDKQR